MDTERKKLERQAGNIIRKTGIWFGEHDGAYYDFIKQKDFIGFAHYYLKSCWNQDELKNFAESSIYIELVEIDSKLGTDITDQLFKCVRLGVRLDLIQVQKISNFPEINISLIITLRPSILLMSISTKWKTKIQYSLYFF